MRLRPATTALALCLVVAPAAAHAAPLAAHRAVYEVKLDDASERSGVKGMDGRLVYDFDGSACDGYTVNFRFVTRIQLDQDVRVTDQQMSTFEELANPSFQFVSRSFTDQRPDREVSGIANAGDRGVEVEIEGGEATIELEPAVFPTQHLLDLIEAAKAGETVYEARVFDGSEEGNRALDTTSVIGDPQTGADAGDDSGALPAEFAGMRYWPVSIAYYSTAQSNGETLPLYRIEMKLYDNGVTRDIAMDYGEFRLIGELSEIEMRDADPCD